MSRLTGLSFIVLSMLVPATPAVQAAPSSIYTFDAARSSLEIDVFKEGFFKMFGHNHLVAAKDFSGRVSLDLQEMTNSSVTLHVAAASLTVMDPGESAKDRADVQTTMQGEKVLDVAKYPEIAFTSTSVEKVVKGTDGWTISLLGNLKLHGMSHVITLPLKLTVHDEDLTAEGSVLVKQTEYGISPVTAVGGTVKVKDQLKIRFAIHALSASRPGA